MGAFERIDETDARILEILQRDGRESYAEVGQAVGMSGPSVHERVKKLEAAGVIRGYSALVDPTLLGYGVLAFIFIKQVPGTIATDMTGDFVGIDEIEECHHLAGEADYLLKVRATDTRHLERVLHLIQQVRTCSRPRPRWSSRAPSNAGRCACRENSSRCRIRPRRDPGRSR
jgi:Lrp/AsnC family leucine-responsive transcriptional regulator